MLWKGIETTIRNHDKHFELSTQRQIGGGCINRCYTIESHMGKRYFTKLNSTSALLMFEAEQDGLREIAQTKTIRVPEPLCCGIAEGQSFIVMEYIPLTGSGQGSTPQLMGEQLAAMHRHTQSNFGWFRANTIGSTPQINSELANWVEFYRIRRLGYQLDLATKNGFVGALQEKGHQLLESIVGFFSNYQPCPALLHGDLWGGNQAADQNGNPVLFDPATYYGDREADIAMTELFGGFSSRFYDAYNHHWPLDAGYGVRKHLYNLYHLLNHANLFGSSYARQAEAVIDRLLSEV